MENLRWILIFAGVAILLVLWFSGRAGRRDPASSGAPDPLLGDGPSDGFGERLDGVDFDGAALDEVSFDDTFADIDPDGVPATQGGRSSGGDRSPLVSGSAPSARNEPPGGQPLREQPSRGQPFEIDPPPSTALSGLAQKFEAIGARLAPKRRQRVAASEPDDTGEEGAKNYVTKIVTLHVVAPDGSILPPEALYEMFERRGYHHGDMSIYHSMYEGKTVFSIARMVKPGTFDPDDLSTFETPGLALILQLPGPVAADTAFEVMLSEAFEIAEELGGSVLDANRSTLGRQTEQHLREGIYEYMHRQKYFDSVV